jgi:hypothetical protein
LYRQGRSNRIAPKSARNIARPNVQDWPRLSGGKRALRIPVKIRRAAAE